MQFIFWLLHDIIGLVIVLISVFMIAATINAKAPISIRIEWKNKENN